MRNKGCCFKRLLQQRLWVLFWRALRLHFSCVRTAIVACATKKRGLERSTMKEMMPLHTSVAWTIGRVSSPRPSWREASLVNRRLQHGQASPKSRPTSDRQMVATTQPSLWSLKDSVLLHQPHKDRSFVRRVKTSKESLGGRPTKKCHGLLSISLLLLGYHPLLSSPAEKSCSLPIRCVYPSMLFL